MASLTSIAAIIAMLLIVGLCVGLADRRNFSLRWLIIAAELVLVNDAMLTRFYGLMPDWIGGAWNWAGKLLALAVTLAVVTLPMFGWRRVGLTLTQKREGRGVTYGVIALIVAVFVGIALWIPSVPANGETWAFQATLPGLEEEVFYRGLLLLALNEAFRGRWHFAGVAWGWGALLTSLLFGMAHAFSYGAEGFALDPIAMLVTGAPALLLVWVRERTGSLLWPVLLHNFANCIPLLL